MTLVVKLELRYINSTEVTFHVDTPLMKSTGWARQNSTEDSFTEVGDYLLEKLTGVEGVTDLMWGRYGFVVNVLPVLDTRHILYQVVRALRSAFGTIELAVTDDSDAFARSDYIQNPSKEAFERQVDSVLEVLRERKNREAQNALELLQTAVQVVRDAGLMSQLRSYADRVTDSGGYDHFASRD